MLAHMGRLAGAATLALALAGCSSMGSMFGGSNDESYADLAPSQSQVAQAASSTIPAIATACPPIRIRSGAEFYRSYAGNRTSDPNALRFQGVIDQVTRNCVSSPGLITVDMGAAGRVILGPSGTEGTVTVPLRVAVQRDGMALFSERYDIAVNVTPSGPNEFTHTLDDLAIPYVGGESITIYVGFDN